MENAATSSGQGLATKQEDANTMETVRDFVEKIVVRLMGNLNDTPIHRLYDHPACKSKYTNTQVIALSPTFLRLLLCFTLKNEL